MKLTKIAKLLHYCALSTLVSCALNFDNTRIIPEYNGVDPKIATYVENYLDLAKQHGITFNKEVSIGFTNINSKDHAIGICYYGIGWREIAVDQKYWNNSTYTTKMNLIRHELTHCYCKRPHDYKKNDSYANYASNPDIAWNDPLEKEGFFNDRCPTSIMFPAVIPDDCFFYHFQHYIDEMFDKCEAY